MFQSSPNPIWTLTALALSLTQWQLLALSIEFLKLFDLFTMIKQDLCHASCCHASHNTRPQRPTTTAVVLDLKLMGNGCSYQSSAMQHMKGLLTSPWMRHPHKATSQHKLQQYVLMFAIFIAVISTYALTIAQETTNWIVSLCVAS